jgi:REP element-mobilizing transposase RayT
MNFIPSIHHRRSIRLKGFDYSQNGAYFITICTQNRNYLFGEIANGEMQLNNAGQMIVKWCAELCSKFADIELHTFIVMPNHFHAIIENVGADLRVRPETETNPTLGEHGPTLGEHGPTLGEHGPTLGEHGPTLGEHAPTLGEHAPTLGEHAPTLGEHGPTLGEHAPNQGEHIGSPLHTVVQWFKTMTTNEYIRGVKINGWKPFVDKMWQRNYYEHIIRNADEYLRIAEYIINNPAKWEIDKLYKE